MERLTAEIEAEATVLAGQRAEVQRLRGALAETRRSSLAEESAAVEAELADVERRLEKAQLRAEGLRMLRDYYLDERQRALADLVGPISGRVQADLEALGLPVERLGLDDQLRPESLVFGRADIQPAQLSFGERTQLVALLRLNLAELLATRGPQLVVLDDQLVHSDARRVGGLVARMQRLPAQVQLLLVTCHPEAYAALTDARWIDVSACGTYHRPAPPPPLRREADEPRRKARRSSGADGQGSLF